MQKNSFADALAALEARIGYTFGDESLPRQALTHSSYHAENPGQPDYERIEFLGDAVLEVLCSEYLYRKYPAMTEGELTKRRAEIVCEPSLAFVARENGFDKLIRLGAGGEKTGERSRASILCDVTEAILGAVYLDGGLEAVRPIAQKLILDREEALPGQSKDAKSLLQEYVQQFGTDRPVYTTLSKEGKDNDPVFTVELSYKGETVCKASGRSKKEAEKEAARIALDILKF